MSKRPPAARRDATATRPAASARKAGSGDRDLAATVAAALLAAAVAGGALAVDVHAAAAFDAPKRLVALAGLAAAAAVMAVAGRRRRPAIPASMPQAAALALAAAGLGMLLVSVVAAPRAAIARDALRAIGLLALALPLGASSALAGSRRLGLLAVFVGAAAMNAGAALLQTAGVELFALAAITGRTEAGGFLGNEGHLAQVAALAGVAAAVVAWRGGDRIGRAGAAAAVAVLVWAILASRNLTALATLATGVAGALALLGGRRVLAPIALVGVLAAAGVAAHPPLRARVADAVRAARSGDWDAVTTYRLGPWSAALEMVRARPLTGFGPGTFGAEFVPHRLRAELRQQRRLVIPLLTTSFAEAHSEYLQAAAEWGMPAALAIGAAGFALLAGLVRIARSADDPRRTEAALVAAVLGAAAVASLTWFPWQRPASAVPLLLMAGRGWRLLAPPDAAVAGRPGWPGAVAAGLTLAAAAVLALAVRPELARWGAERRLAAATAALEGLAAGGRVVPEARPMLEGLAATASATAAADPADTRGFLAAGTAMLLAGAPADAERWYRAALARGERAEIDLNLARAYALAGRRDEAEAALVRAAWLAPALAATLPSADRTRVGAAVAALEARLRGGALTAPPPLPEAAAAPLPDAAASPPADGAAPPLPGAARSPHA